MKPTVLVACLASLACLALASAPAEAAPAPSKQPAVAGHGRIDLSRNRIAKRAVKRHQGPARRKARIPAAITVAEKKSLLVQSRSLLSTQGIARIAQLAGKIGSEPTTLTPRRTSAGPVRLTFQGASLDYERPEDSAPSRIFLSRRAADASLITLEFKTLAPTLVDCAFDLGDAPDANFFASAGDGTAVEGPVQDGHVVFLANPNGQPLVTPGTSLANLLNVTLPPMILFTTEGDSYVEFLSCVVTPQPAN